MSEARKLPQTNAFGGSREDTLSALAFFFGDPAVPEKLRDYSEHHAMTYHFPDAYYGQNTKIRETLNNLILKAPQEWHTQVALPFVKIEGTTVEWDELRFDVRLLQRVPYEGVSRMQTSLRRRHRDRVVRRGIGMTIESDFYATEAGRQHFTDQLTSIRYCVQETCNFDTIYSYLTSSNYDFRYDMSKGLRPRRSVRTAMAHEVNLYAIVQKEGLGMDKAIEDCKYRMSRYSVTPNMLIVAPQLLLYLATAPEEKLKYYEGGDRAVTRFEEGMAGYEARAYRGLGVFASMPYEVSDDQDSVQMLQRSTQVGEFYRMYPPPVWDWDNKKLIGNYMDILIYDEEADKHQHITLKTALDACTLDDAQLAEALGWETGENKTETRIVVPKDFVVTDGKGGTEQGESKVKEWLRTSSSSESLKDAILTDVANGIWLPLCIVIARPFIEHLTMSAIMTVSGRDTGATLFGPADMQISANTSVKTIEGHYTCHTKSVITKPQNVMVMRDIMCTGYVAGGNCQFFGMDRANKFGSEDKMEQQQAIQEAINNRLSFADDVAGDYASMLSFPCNYDEEVASGYRDQVISISERMLPWEVTRHTMQGDKKGFPGGSANYAKFKDMYQLDQIHFGEDTRAIENMEFISQGSVNNALCFIGPHRRYNPFSASFFELVPGQGHFGPDAIPGDARWRRGESVSQTAARNSMTSLEVAQHSQLAFRPSNAFTGAAGI